MTPVPAGLFGSDDYCSLDEVTARLYSGQGLAGSLTNPPVDTTRDAFLSQLITQRSRDFDQAVWGNLEYPGLFSWRLETRLYSGLGQQDLSIGPFAKLAKIEIAATPGQIIESFQDYTVEVSQNRIGFRPIRGFPKHVIFRQSTFYVDPFRLGNVRVTGIWGIVQPSTLVDPPNEDWEDAYLDPITTNATTYHGVDSTASGVPAITDLAPDGGGWWATPDDVRAAVASWVVHTFQSAKTGYGTNSGQGSSKMTTNKKPPDDVQDVITRYAGQNSVPKFALVADDGSDVDQMGQYPVWRWAGWQTHT